MTGRSTTLSALDRDVSLLRSERRWSQLSIVRPSLDRSDIRTLPGSPWRETFSMLVATLALVLQSRLVYLDIRSVLVHGGAVWGKNMYFGM